VDPLQGHHHGRSRCPWGHGEEVARPSLGKGERCRGKRYYRPRRQTLYRSRSFLCPEDSCLTCAEWVKLTLDPIWPRLGTRQRTSADGAEAVVLLRRANTCSNTAAGGTSNGFYHVARSRQRDGKDADGKEHLRGYAVRGLESYISYFGVSGEHGGWLMRSEEAQSRG
jgi:hypothetical protein